MDGPPYPGVVDATNVFNPHQGALRYGLLDVDQWTTEVARDFRAAENLAHEPGIAITCADQLDGRSVRCYEAGREVEISFDRLCSALGCTRRLHASPCVVRIFAADDG